jgi:ATP-dependent DNA ligase
MVPTSGRIGARTSTSGASEAVAMALSLSPLPPGFIVPCLPTPSVGCKSGPAWVHEIKHDGYRVIARHTDDRVRLYTRRGTEAANAVITLLGAR